MKRFIGIIMSLIFSTLSIVGVSAEADNEYSDNVELMKGLGIFTSDFEKNEDDNVTRADFVKYVLNFRGIEADQYAQNVGFYDVDEMSSYATYVNAGVNLGFVSGFGDGTFRPEEAVICEHATKIMVAVLGGDKLVKEGLTTTAELANKFGVSVKADGKAEMTYGLLTKLLKNGLSAKPLLFEVGENNAFTFSENDALWVFHKTEKIRGIVTANDLTGLSSVNGAVNNDGYIRLGNEEMKYDADSYNDILGKQVEAYVCREDEAEPVIKYMTETNKNTVTVIQNDMIYSDDSGFSAYNFVYENENGKKIEKKLDGAYIIYNGIAKPDYSKENISPKIGWVTIIDNNSDGKIDIVNVFNADLTVVCGTVSVNSNFTVITDKFDNSKTIRVESDKVDDTQVFINGEVSNIGNIKDGMLILKGSNGDHTIMYVYDQSFVGKVNGTHGDTLSIDSKRYKYSESANIDRLKLNMQYRFYTDDKDCIFAFDKIGSDNDLHYGYLLDYKTDNESGNLDAIILKILTDDNVLERFYVRSQIKVNDKNHKLEKLDELLNPNGIFTRQPVRYKFDENNNITLLYTVTKDGMLRYEGEFTGEAEYAFYADTWSQKFYQDRETLVFNIFDDPESCYVEGAFKNIVLNPRPYTHYFYNVDEDLNTVDMVVWKRTDAASQKAENILPETQSMVVTDVTQMLDSDDQVRDCIVCRKGSDEIKVYYNDKMIQVYKDRFNSVKAGDIIYCEFDGKGNLVKIFKGFDSSQMHNYGISNQSYTVNGQHLVVAHARKKLAYIKVKEKLNNRFIKYDEGTGIIDSIQKIQTNARIYKISKSSRGVTVSLSSYDEIMPGDEIYFDADTNSVWYLYILDYK
ncbi:MAG: S-layer homology domain-containing protein [Clostridia bacterium]|nr:S-layer homology domain-containing protein [Clostridia bacterium]